MLLFVDTIFLVNIGNKHHTLWDIIGNVYAGCKRIRYHHVHSPKCIEYLLCVSLYDLEVCGDIKL